MRTIKLCSVDEYTYPGVSHLIWDIFDQPLLCVLPFKGAGDTNCSSRLGVSPNRSVTRILQEWIAWTVGNRCPVDVIHDSFERHGMYSIVEVRTAWQVDYFILPSCKETRSSTMNSSCILDRNVFTYQVNMVHSVSTTRACLNSLQSVVQPGVLVAIR